MSDSTMSGNYVGVDDLDDLYEGDEFQDYLNCPRTLNAEKYKNVNPSHTPGSGAWLFEHQSFREWRNRDRHDVLLLSADAGCGKSVLSRALIDTKMLGDNTTVCYFFFMNNEDQNNGYIAMRAILYQLFMAKGEKVFHLGADIKGIDGLWKLLQVVINDPTLGEVVCILDGLDQCNVMDQLHLTDLIQDFYRRARNSPPLQASRLKLLITSRPSSPVEARILEQEPALMIPKIFASKEEQFDEFHAEIDLLIQETVQKLKDTHNLENEFTELLYRRLRLFPTRSYLWVRLIKDEIEANLASGVRDLEMIISSLSNTEEEAYEKILAKSANEPRTEFILQVLATARVPLSLDEIRDILNTHFADVPGSISYLENDDATVAVIKNLLGELVYLVDSRVHFIHQTVTDYLFSRTSNVDNSVKKFSSDQAHRILAEFCVSYLLNNDLMLRIWDYKTKQQKITEHLSSHPLFQYAANHWITHIKCARVGTEDPILEKASKLCEIRYPTLTPWLHIAEKWGKFHSLRYEPNLESKHGLSILWAVLLQFRELAEYLLLNGADANASTGPNGSLVTLAAFHNHITMMKLLITYGANLNAEDSFYGNALHAACNRDNIELLKLLLENGANPYLEVGVHGSAFKSAFSCSPLSNKVVSDPNGESHMYASEVRKSAKRSSRRKKVIKLFLEQHPDPNGPECIFGAQDAASQGIADGLELFLEYGTDVKSQGGNYGNLLQAACVGGNMAIVQQILDSGVDVNIQGGKFGNALQAACASSQKDIVQLLLSKGADVNASGGFHGSVLQAAADLGTFDIVKILIDANVDLEAHEGLERFSPNLCRLRVCGRWHYIKGKGTN